MAVFIVMSTASSCILEHDNVNESLNRKPGDYIPPFEVALTDGSTITDDTLEGSTSLVLLFDKDIRKSEQQLLEIQKLYDKFKKSKPEGFSNFVLISRCCSQKDIDALWRELNLTIPCSPQEGDCIFAAFAYFGSPVIYISDSKNVIKYYHCSEVISADALLDEIEDTINSSLPTPDDDDDDDDMLHALN